MIKKVMLVSFLTILISGMLFSQTKENKDDQAAYSIGYSTYLSQVDRYFAGFDVFSDSKGFVYVSGNTRDKNFPATPGAIQTQLKGEADAFVAKFSPDGKIVFATLIGGTKREHHTGITVDKDGYIYLVGGTHSDDFPVTADAYDESFNGEKEWGGDVYLVKLNPSGSGILFSTFIGGSAQETAHQVAIDPRGDIIVAGITLSQDFPVTDGAFDKKCEENESFIAKFSANGEELKFSTFFGGSENDNISGLAIDNKGDIYFAGSTKSKDLPITENAVRSDCRHVDGGFSEGFDLFLAKLDNNGKKLYYCTYFGGKSYVSSSLSWASPNSLIFCGNVDSGSFPTTETAIANKVKGDRDGFVSIFNSDKMELKYSTVFGGKELDYIGNAYMLNEDMVVIGGLTNSADLPLTPNALDNNYPVSNKLFNSGFTGRRKAFISVIDIKKKELVFSTYIGACLRFKMFPDEKGNLGFMAEVGEMTFPGLTEFPLSQNAFQSPYTHIMLGRLLSSNISR